MSKKTFELTFSHGFLKQGSESFICSTFMEQLEQWQQIHNNRDYYVECFEGKEVDQGFKIIARCKNVLLK